MSAIVHVYNRPAGGGGPSVPAYPELRSDKSPTNFDLIWGDDFTGASLNRTKWGTHFPNGGGPPLTAEFGNFPDDEWSANNTKATLAFLNDERERYQDFLVGNPSYPDGTLLHQFGTVGGRTCLKLMAYNQQPDPGWDWATYRSGMICSKQTFLPVGNTCLFMTCDLWLPDADGSWPAFWLASALNPDGTQSWPPEVDYMEAAQSAADLNTRVFASVKVQNPGGVGNLGNAVPIVQAPKYERNYGNFDSPTSMKERWQTWWAMWSRGHVTVGIGDQIIFRSVYEWKTNAGVTSQPAHVLINLAIGGAWPGTPDETKFPYFMGVSNCRVYSRTRSDAEMAAYESGLILL